MPKKSKPRQIARAARKNPARGKSRTQTRCPRRSGPEAGRPDFLADSLSALRLKVIPGAKRISGQSVVGGFSELVKSVSQCVVKLYPGEKLMAPKGLPDYEELGWWQNKLRAALPKGADYTIEYDEHTGFSICIHSTEEWHGNTLYHLFVADILEYLAHYNPKGRELFLDFLGKFARTICCDTWFTGVFAHGIERLEEMLECEPDALDPESIDDAKEELAYYQTGEGKELGLRIHKSRLRSLDYIRDNARAITDPFIRELVLAGCELMEPGFSMTQFVDVVGAENDYYGESGLRFDSQASIMLFDDSDTSAMHEYDSWIESYWHEGGFQDPINFLRIQPNDRKPPDFQQFDRRRKWLRQLNQYFMDFINTAFFYYYERTKSKVEITV